MLPLIQSYKNFYAWTRLVQRQAGQYTTSPVAWLWQKQAGRQLEILMPAADLCRSDVRYSNAFGIMLCLTEGVQSAAYSECHSDSESRRYGDA